MRIVFIISILCCSFLSLSQGNIGDFNLPKKVEGAISRICCDCEIYGVMAVPVANAYHFKYLSNGVVNNVSVDSCGQWIRTFQEVIFDSIPVECISIFEEELNRYNEEYKFEGMLMEGEVEITDSKFKLNRVLKEFNEQGTIGYYDFVVDKPFKKGILFGDTLESFSTRHIKINFYCQLLNANGNIVLRLDYPNPRLAISSIDKGLSASSPATTISEYSHGELNGLSIDYYSYPDVVASVSYYENNVAKGPFISYYPNGKIKEVGAFADGMTSFTDKWYFDGTPYLKISEIDTTGSLFSFRDGRALHGRYVMSGEEVYFSNGLADSVISRDNFSRVIIQNYVDSTRTLINYDTDGFVKDKLIVRIAEFSIGAKNMGDFVSLSDNCTLSDEIRFIDFHSNSLLIKEMGSYKGQKKIGTWYFYNDRGGLIKKEEYTE